MIDDRGFRDFVDAGLMTEEQLGEVVRELTESNAEFQKLTKAAEKSQEQFDKYTDQMHEAEKAMQAAAPSAQDAGDKIKDVGKKSEDAGKKAKESAEGGITTLQIAFAKLVADGVKLAISALKGFISTGIEYNATLERIEQSLDEIFGEKAADNIRKWAENSLDAFGLSKKKALDFAMSLKMIGESAGLVSGKSTEMAKGITELSGKWSMFKGIEPDKVFSTLELALSGSYRGMRELNVSMGQNTLQAYENAKGQGRLYSKMTESEKMWLRYNYLISESEKQMKGWDSTTQTLSGSQVKLKERLEEFSGKLAKEFVPILSDLLSETNDYLREHGDTLSNLGQVIATVINVFANLIKIIASVPPEVLIMVGMIASAVKVYLSLKKALDPIEGSLGAVTKAMSVGSKSTDMFMVKILALIAALSVLLFLILSIKEGSDKASKSLQGFSNESGKLADQNVAKAKKHQGRATGTPHAPAGWAWVGENGPELMRFSGGEQVLTAPQVASALTSRSENLLSTSSYTDNSQLILNVHGIEEMQQVVNWFNGRRIKARAGGTL